VPTDSIQIPGYEVLRPLGTGGMSTVYLAQQRSLERKVAIKVMRRVFTADVDAAQIEKRFLLEGRMLAKLPHRNIVAVYDIVSNDDIAYIAMEYLGGGVLSDRMRTGLSLADAIAVIVQIASALEFAHSRGVVHRDLKPANIMFRDTGAPVLTDFGIARSQDGSAMRLTQTGMLVGTPTYMSPEQINGVAVDGRADQYSLGILFYELLTGAPPFRADTSIAVLMAHLSQPLPPLPPEFHAFEDVIARMLSKNRDERYPNLNEFNEDLKSRLFNSDTLMMRLQVDPSQPSSEQLRALGFSTSTPSAGGMRDIASLRTPTPVPRSRVAQPSQQAAGKRAPWLIAAGVAAALLLGIGGWYVSHWRSELGRAERAELVSAWLDRAAQRIEAGQFTQSKDGESAYDYLQKVLQKEPANATAQILLDRIASLTLARGQVAFVGGDSTAALALIDEGLRVRPVARVEGAHRRTALAGFSSGGYRRCSRVGCACRGARRFRGTRECSDGDEYRHGGGIAWREYGRAEFRDARQRRAAAERVAVGQCRVGARRTSASGKAAGGREHAVPAATSCGQIHRHVSQPTIGKTRAGCDNRRCGQARAGRHDVRHNLDAGVSDACGLVRPAFGCAPWPR